MAATVNRAAVLLNLAAFLGCGVFCAVTQAPLIQQDILRRCREALSSHRLSPDGVAVDGRDVIVSGPPDSPLAAPGTIKMLAALPGVRSVHFAAGDDGGQEAGADLEPAASPQQIQLQEKIDLLLQNQNISFKTDIPVLTPEGESSLRQIADLLVSAPNVRCEIRGYDNHSSEARENWAAALQRALAVEDYFVSAGVAEWRVSARAFQDSNTGGRRGGARPIDIVVRGR